jgi:kinesin family protein 11
LASTVQSSYLSIGETFSTSFNRIESLDSDMSSTTSALQDTLPTLAADAPLRRPLRELREQIESDKLEEYAATGLTPAKKEYEFPLNLPRTDARDKLLDKLRNGGQAEEDVDAYAAGAVVFKSPSKGLVFADMPSSKDPNALNTRPGTGNSANTSTSTTSGLRELDLNTFNPVSSIDTVPELPTQQHAEKLPLPPLKRFNTTEGRGPMLKKRGIRRTVAGNALLAERMADRENVTMPNLSASAGVGAVHPGVGRRLRSHERNGS